MGRQFTYLPQRYWCSSAHPVRRQSLYSRFSRHQQQSADSLEVLQLFSVFEPLARVLVGRGAAIRDASCLHRFKFVLLEHLKVFGFRAGMNLDLQLAYPAQGVMIVLIKVDQDKQASARSDDPPQF